MTSLAVGMVYGLAHASTSSAVLHDRYQPSASMAAYGVLVLGIVIGIVALPLLAAALYWVTLRHSYRYGVLVWLVLTGVCAAAWVGGFIVAYQD